MNRVDRLETQMDSKQDEVEVRQLLEDKLSPIKSELEAINRSLEKVIDHLIDKK